MKKLITLVLASIIGGALALGGYWYFFESPSHEMSGAYEATASHPDNSSSRATSKLVLQDSNGSSAANPDFTKAAEKTVHAVVHVKNVEIVNSPRSFLDYLNGNSGGGKYIRGIGSGVIITPDGYIVTNNHVIEGASELEVTLNNNETYKAKVIGSVPREDIALIKIDAEELDYLPFGDSDSARIGQWVLAVGNPFNLTSTVTAGIISAKGRNLDEGATTMQSFIQTDAAVNPGNSGGALVNTNGELIGINTAITSATGSYVGYSFAIPSNNARKIVEDLMEYGNVKQAILGIMGNTIGSDKAKERGISISQGVLIASVSEGAKEAGLQSGDVITRVDSRNVRKMSDLSAYIKTKRPGDKVDVEYYRGKEKGKASVKLTEYESYVMVLGDANLEVVNADPAYLHEFRAKKGVRIAQTTSSVLQIPQDYFIIIGVDGQAVESVKDVERIMGKKDRSENTKVTFQARNGSKETVVF